MPTPQYHINPTVFCGRPAASFGRSQTELAVYELLDQLNIQYQRIDHDPLPTIEACQEADRLLNTQVCKNLFLCTAQKDCFYLLMLPGWKKFRTAALSKQIGSSRLSFGDPCFMEEFLGLTPGSVSVLGLMNDKNSRVRLLIDQDILAQEFIGCHPCVNTSSLKLRTQDLLRIILPAIGHSYTPVTLPA